MFKKWWKKHFGKSSDWVIFFALFFLLAVAAGLLVRAISLFKGGL